MQRTNKRFPNMNLFLGSFLLFIGVILLLLTNGKLASLGLLWPAPFIILGLFFLYLTFMKERSRHYMLPGLFLSLMGTYIIILINFFSYLHLAQIWPTFMLITGISIMPYSFVQPTRKSRIALLIPAIAIIILSIIFLLFSLKLVEMKFKDFVLRWWPALIVLSGCAFIITHFTKQRDRK